MRFSIIIPCLNRGHELQAAIESCLSQSNPDFEVVVVDDGSTPPLQELCNAFADPRIRYHRNTSNLGVSASRNVGIDLAQGQFVSFLDSDDIYLPNRLESLERCIASCEAPPEIVFHRQNRLIGPDASAMVSPRRLPAPGERLDDYILIHGHFVQTNTVIVDRLLARRVRFDERCTRHEDTKFVIECWLESRNFAVDPDVLSEYRDYRQSSRLSKQQGFDRLRPILDFAERSCSTRSYLGFAAYSVAEKSFFTHPIRNSRTLLQAYRSGTPLARCLIFLARSIFGTATVDQIVQLIRRGRIRLRSQISLHTR
ncbi:glycosyltransferase [Bradyrhizobium sp. B117]|uniref:glycosyltransferase family 2 protein n=1 Tax=Bradyrhizobium sp. B117 TaxID=3140246 RepID=UPI003183A871